MTPDTYKNSQGKIWYGLHFYPGVAEYSEPGKSTYRVFLNSQTLRKMDPSFAGRPIFVEHVDEVKGTVEELRKEAEGWVVESFFNSADGNHWVKMVTVSARADRAIQNGFGLSNCYFPKSFASGGQLNGVDYAKEITSGEYEHLAIVRHPRYNSMILSPEQFKKYNEDKVAEVKRLANSKDKKEKKGMFQIFKRERVENSADLESMSIVLPKSQKEMKLSDLVELGDKVVNMHGYASDDHMVKVNDTSEMSVKDLVKAHMGVCNEFEEFKKKTAAEKEESEKKENAEDEDEKDEEKKKNKKKNSEEEKPAEEVKKEEVVAEPSEEEKAAEEKKAEDKAKADAVRNAHLNVNAGKIAKVEFSDTQVQRGKDRYGSLK